MKDAESLYDLADKAMYLSKRSGKNRVAIVPPSGVLNENGQSAKVPQESQQERKQRIRNQLAEFLKQGQEILNGVEYRNIVSVQEKHEWKLRVQRYLAEELDKSYVARFESPKYRVLEFPPNMHATMRTHWAEVRSRMDMLHDFIADFRD